MTSEARRKASQPKSAKHQPTIGVFKFASCDGCQLSLLDAEDELLAVVGQVEIAYFPEASRAMAKGPYDLGLVEGSITTHHDAQRIQEIRRQCKTLITIGACATAGGIQALRNWKDVDEFIRVVYATPQFISTLKLSTPIAEHVPVDELRLGAVHEVTRDVMEEGKDEVSAGPDPQAGLQVVAHLVRVECPPLPAEDRLHVGRQVGRRRLDA